MSQIYENKTSPTPAPAEKHVLAPHVAQHRSSPFRTILLIAALVLGVVLGAQFNDQIRHTLGIAGHADHSVAAGQEEQKQLWTCGMHPQVIQDTPGTCPICGMALEPVKAGAAAGGHNASGIQVDPVVVQNMGVRVSAVEEGPIRQTIRAVGYLDEAQPNVHDVNLRVSGWIEKLYANTEGMHLKKGDPLFDLYSPEVKVAIEELISVRRAREASTGAEAIGRRNADTLAEAAQRKLELWGIPREEIDRLARLDRAPATVTFRSPITGDITEKMVVQGAAVKAGDRILQIADHSTLWLDAQVYAQDQPAIKMGQKVTATIEGIRGRQFEGEVVFIHPHIDPMTRTAKVRMALPNPQMTLRPGMYATVQIIAELADRVALIPREAVIDTGERQVVFVALEKGHFEPRKVQIGLEGNDGNVQVVSGVAPGETVVTSGQFLLDAESRMKEAIQKHLHEKLLKPAAPQVAAAKTNLAADARPAQKSYGHGHWTTSVDALVKAYLEISESLGVKQQNSPPVDPAKVEAAAKALVTHVPADELKPLVERISTAAAAMAGKTSDEQRKLFSPLSDAIIALLDRLPASKAAADKLLVVHCSMAPGTWLQRSEPLANPYYATEMKQCGEVQRQLELANTH